FGIPIRHKDFLTRITFRSCSSILPAQALCAGAIHLSSSPFWIHRATSSLVHLWLRKWLTFSLRLTVTHGPLTLCLAVGEHTHRRVRSASTTLSPSRSGKLLGILGVKGVSRFGLPAFDRTHSTSAVCAFAPFIVELFIADFHRTP